MTKKITAFVIMPFKEEFNDIYKLGILAAAKQSKVTAYRLDDELFEEGMLEKIYTEIRKADFIIADLSEKNPNVFYELGFAHALGKLCILITNQAESIPFDLKHKRHLVYNKTIIDLIPKLKENIKWAKREIENKKNQLLDVRVITNGILISDANYAKGELELFIYFENNKLNKSVNISAIYIHTVQDWSFKINNEACSKRLSDQKGYTFKYQIHQTERLIEKNGWMDLKLHGYHYFALFYEEYEEDSFGEIKDSYSVNGSVLIEVYSKEESTFYKFPIKQTFDTLPF